MSDINGKTQMFDIYNNGILRIKSIFAILSIVLPIGGAVFYWGKEIIKGQDSLRQDFSIYKYNQQLYDTINAYKLRDITQHQWLQDSQIKELQRASKDHAFAFPVARK